jgi:hypothetical protein
VLFCPATPSANLLLINESSRQPVEWIDSLIDVWQTDARGTSNEHVFLNTAPSHSSGIVRSFGSSVLEIHTSNYRGFFGSSRFATGPYDDWSQCLHFGESLGKYCTSIQCDTVAITVDGEGGTLFPSERMRGSVRNDAGLFSPDGRDPIRKDQVELLYRILSRYDLRLVPMLELSAAIPEIEAAIKNNDAHDALLTVHGVSQTSNGNEGTSHRENERRYNPASARVQHALTEVIEELETRYKSQPDYTGVAIRIDPSSHLSAATPMNRVNPKVFELFDLETNRGSKQAVKNIEARSSDARNLTLTESGFRTWQSKSAIQLLDKSKAKIAWVSSASHLEASVRDGLPLESKLAVEVPIPIQDLPAELTSSSNSLLKRWSDRDPAFTHYVIASPPGLVNQSLVELNRMGSTFPRSTSSIVPHRDGANSISRVRILYNGDSGSSVLIANPSAVDELIQIAWDTLPMRCDIEAVSEPNQVSKTTENPGRYLLETSANEWKMLVPANAALRIQCDANGPCKPIYWQAYDAILFQSLTGAIQLLEQAVTRYNTPLHQSDLIVNAGFEKGMSSLLRGRFEGWSTSLDPSATVSLDGSFAAEGKQSVKIDARKGTSAAWLQSEPFAVGRVDRLLVSLQSKTKRTPDRMVLTLSQYDPNSERFESVAMKDLTVAMNRESESTNWSTHAIDFSEEITQTTLEPLASLFRIQIAVNGQAQLWLDDVRVSTDYLREDERRDLRSEIFLAKTSLRGGDTGPVNALLASDRVRLLGVLESNHANEQAKFISKSSSSAQASGSEAKTQDPKQSDPNGVVQPGRPMFGRRLRGLWGRDSR